jgi:hypothetical protein
MRHNSVQPVESQMRFQWNTVSPSSGPKCWLTSKRLLLHGVILQIELFTPTTVRASNPTILVLTQNALRANIKRTKK